MSVTAWLILSIVPRGRIQFASRTIAYVASMPAHGWPCCYWALVAAVLAAAATATVATAAVSPSSITTVQVGGLGVAVDTTTGSYVLSVDGVAWLRSAPPRLLPGVPLILVQAQSVSGKDGLGIYHGVSIYWERADGRSSDEAFDLQTIFKGYDTGGTASVGHRELITFTQVYPAGIADTTLYFNASNVARMETCPKFSDRIPIPPSTPPVPSAADQDQLGQKPSPLPRSSATALGRFPAFSLKTQTTLNWFAPQGNQLAATTFGRVAPLRLNALDGQGSMPLLMYNNSGRSIALAPLDHFFNAVHETATSADILSLGVAGSVPSLPPGFEYTTILVGDRGINTTLVSLGNILLQHGGGRHQNQTGYHLTPKPKPRLDPSTGGSFVLAHLGFWTDSQCHNIS